MEFFKNKNNTVLVISAALILVAILVAVIATASSNKKEKEALTSTNEAQVELQKEIQELKKQINEAKATSHPTGKYKVVTKDDPLGLRLEPSTDSNILILVPKGYEIDVLAVYQDWGYVVYQQTGGWLSMNYLELISSDSGNSTEKAS